MSYTRTKVGIAADINADSIHNYKLTESAKEGRDEFSHYIFTVRRKFDWENKYKNTVVDIKSKLLREAMQEIMKDVKGVSLVEDVPSVSEVKQDLPRVLS